MSQLRKIIAKAAIVAALTFGASFGWVTRVEAQWVVFDPTNYVQNFLTQLRALESNINELQEIRNQVQGLQNMAQNTSSITGGNWNGISNTLSQLDSTLSQGNNIAITAGNFDQQFRQQFPGYQAPQGQNYSQAYAQWNTASLNATRSAMDAASIQYQNVGNEHDAIAQLQVAAQTSGGQKAALDAANQIALNQLTQTQKLRELMMAQMQSQGSYIAAQQQKDAAQAMSVDQALQYQKTTVTEQRTKYDW